MTIETASPVNQHSPPESKIALFRRLFRGRDDVYPVRFESKNTGKSGYSPACANEWVRGVCEKGKVKCPRCTHRQFFVVTDEVIRWHLSGLDEKGQPFTAGVYPMLLDETCYFLAMDFDKDSWAEDVLTVQQTCKALELPSAIERSRSGDGAHLWLFFAEALPAAMARRLGSHILTRTMKSRPEIGLDSYDRFFPNQDTLPKGGFGNLIALPLQKAPREKGNSAFLDSDLTPFRDQWAFLDSVETITRKLAEGILATADHASQCTGIPFVDAEEDDSKPWHATPSRQPGKRAMGPLPKEVRLTLGNEIYIEKEALSAPLRNHLIRMASFQNPEFYKAQAMRLPVFDKPRVVCCAEDHPKYIALPRGCLEEITHFFEELKIRILVQDERFAGQSLNLAFQGTLRPEQKEATRTILAHDTGVLAAATAFGKTVVASSLIASRGVNTLVLVHRQQLLEQWIDRLSTFLDIPVKSIGRIGGGRKKATGSLDVALIQSLVRKGVVNDIVADYGHLIVDECHHLPAWSFEQVARRAKAKYVLGLSATVVRKDGHHPIICMQCGPIRHRVHAKAQAEERTFAHRVIVRSTPFRQHDLQDEDLRVQYHELCQAIMQDAKRNQMVVADILKSLQEGRKPVVLTERKEHLEVLHASLQPHVENCIVLKGGMGRRGLSDAMERLTSIPEEEQRVLLATGRFLGEGFDDARLDTLFLTMPVSWRGTIAQYVGRLHRHHERKQEVRVYDYADLNVPMLSRMFDKRCKGYEESGYQILLPASAVPGWPPEVPLPVEASWKERHAASVKRLVRDGVDAHLGDLFVHAACKPRTSIDDAPGARSASEAFLFRRLETIPETAGLFELNSKLPIPFDQQSNMEVDLFCSQACIAVELDGPQHLESAEAYRRDRRKDALLQENGHLVLRFLAADLGTHLDVILDTILRAMSNRRHLKKPGRPKR